MTTLYNHNSLGNAEKPLIPNKDFKELCNQIKTDENALPNALNKWTLEHFQKQLINQLHIKYHGTYNNTNAQSSS